MDAVSAPHRVIMAATMAALVLASSPLSWAGSHTIELRDHLGIDWKSELLNYPFEAEAGECHPESLRLEGPEGPVPVQLSDVEYWPGGEHVRRATLSFVADLPALAEHTYTVSYSPSPTDAAQAAENLDIEQEGDTVTITSSRFGFRALVGEATFDAPRDPSDVPAPVQAVCLADGTWFGDGSMYGESRIQGYRARLDAGPIFGRVHVTYEYEDGNTLDVFARLHSGSRRILVHTRSAEDQPDDGFRLYLTQNLPSLTLPIQRMHSSRRALFDDADVQIGGWAEVSLDEFLAEETINLTPWADWFWDTTMPTIRLGIDDARELHVSRRHAGEWVEPAEIGTWRRWEAWHHKYLALKGDEDGEAYLRFNNAQGDRHLEIGEFEPTRDVGWKPRRDRLGRPVGAQVTPERLRLDEVKDYVLDWPASSERHPRLFVGADKLEQRWRDFEENPWPDQEQLIERGRNTMRGELPPSITHHDRTGLAAYLLSGGDPELANELGLVDRLRHHLGLMGHFDRMRSTDLLASLYDALIDTNLINDTERDMLRARMALVAYQLADPSTWSIEHGYRSYNPNMSVSYVMGLGQVALLLRDHPKADEWLERPLHMMRDLIDVRITPHGEWLESMHYVHPGTSEMFGFAVAARQAGMEDYFAEPGLQRLGRFIAHQYTPRDVRHRNERVVPPVGRGTTGMAWGHIGVIAAALRDVNPELAEHLQFIWKHTNYATGNIGVSAFEYVYSDPSLPATKPDWGTTQYPNVSVILQRDLGGNNEHYVNFLAEGDTFGTIRPQEVGSIVSWFAHGTPIASAFANPEPFRMDRMMNQVTPADPIDLNSLEQGDNRGRAADVGESLAFARLDSADYSSARYSLRSQAPHNWRLPGLPVWPEAGEATGEVEWQRQLLFMAADDPAKPHYIVLNDTIQNDQPTRWHFWSISQRLGPTDEAQSDDFLTDAPGLNPTPARELTGDQFTAVGQFDIDLDYFIAEPTDTPRHTLRYGGQYRAYQVDIHDYQDLLHLQLPGAGRYCVVLFPRKQAEAPATFERLADGRIIRIDSPAGIDYIMLRDESVTAETDDGEIAFATNAGVVRHHDNGVALILPEEGRVRSGEVSLQSDGPAELRRDGERWELKVDPGEPLTYYNVRNWFDFDIQKVDPRQIIRVRIHAPDAHTWELADLPESVEYERLEGQLFLTIPREVRDVALQP